MPLYASALFDNWAGVSSLSQYNEEKKVKKDKTDQLRTGRFDENDVNGVTPSELPNIQIQNNGKTEVKHVAWCEHSGQNAKVK